MLNIKKGLALVLAAATAFTFAPVANLGVTANAATTDAQTSLTIPSAAFTGANAGTGEFSTQPIADGVANTYAMVSGNGFYFDDVIIKAQKDHTYALEDADGTYVYTSSHSQTDGSADPVKTAALALKSTIGSTNKDSNGNLKLDIWVPTAGSHTLVFSDRTTTGDASGSVKSISFTIKSEKDASNISGLDIYKATHSSFTASAAEYAKDTTSGSMKNNDGIYALSMNDDDNGYFVDGLSTAAVTAWNGMAVTGTTNTVSDSSNTLKVVAGTKYGSTATDPKVDDNSYVRLIPTAPTNGTLNLKVTAQKSNDTIATIYLPFAVDKSANAIDKLSFTDNFKHTSYVDNGTAQGAGYLVQDSSDKAKYTLTGLDKQVHNAGQFTVKAESGEVSFKSEDSKIVAVDDAGKLTVNGVGTTKVYIFVGSTQNNKALTAVVTVKVADWADDELSVDTTNGTDLDVSTQTAENKVLNTTLKITSAGGLKTKIEQISGQDFFTVDTNTGVITSKDKAGEGYVKVTSITDTGKAISGTTVTKKITVWTLPAAVFTVPDVTVEAGKSTLLTANVAKPNPYSIVWNNSDNSTLYTLSNAEQAGILNNNTQTTSRLTAGSAVGTAKIYATVLGTTTTRPTTKTATVTVLNKALTNQITLDAASKALVLKEGETAQLKGTASIAGKTVTFQGGDANVATVTTAGAVTAVKAGTTTITAVSDGADSVSIPVVVVAKVNTPAQVTGVKVANVKGGKVKVTWTADKDSNVKYYVKKTVSGKSAGKSVGANSTTLTVKKGATVKVKVKAYVYDNAGKKLVGAYSTTVTKKTDNK